MTCQGRVWSVRRGEWVARRETVGMVCQTCGHDYASRPADEHTQTAAEVVNEWAIHEYGIGVVASVSAWREATGRLSTLVAAALAAAEQRGAATELRALYAELWAKKDALTGDLAGHVAFCALMIRDRADELDPQ